MNKQEMAHDKNRKRSLVHKEGVTYYSREGERRFYFILTLIMLLAGILYKIGVF